MTIKHSKILLKWGEWKNEKKKEKKRKENEQTLWKKVRPGIGSFFWFKFRYNSTRRYKLLWQEDQQCSQSATNYIPSFPNKMLVSEYCAGKADTRSTTNYKKRSFSQPQITDKNKKLTNKIKFLWLLLSSKPRGVCGNMKLRFFSLTTCHLLLVRNISWTPKLVARWRQALIYAILHKLQFLSSRLLGNAHFLCSLKTDA